MAIVISATGLHAQTPAESDRIFLEAVAASAAGRGEQAVGLFTQAIAANPKRADAYYLRGRETFRLGRIQESLADFDKLVELRPELESRQWERGISAYYAGEYEKGAKQFALYQSFHNADVENAVWRFLCQARTSGVEKARADLLPIEGDTRVPMQEIYALYQGKAKPDDVLAAARQGNPPAAELNEREFYALLYLGLYYEATGEPKLARQHLRLAEEHKLDHYMWDVAHVHLARLAADDATK